MEDRWHVETVIAALRQPRPEPAELSTLQDEFILYPSFDAVPNNEKPSKTRALRDIF